MASFFRNTLKTEIGTTPVEIISVGTNTRSTVIGLSLTNLTAGVILASIRLEDTVAEQEAYFIKEVIVPPNQSLRVINGGERLVLGPSTNVKLSCNADFSMDMVLSYVEIV
jgi:hypothetical protein